MAKTYVRLYGPPLMKALQKLEGVAVEISKEKEIKDLFQSLKDLGEETESTVTLYTLGSPKYRVEVTAEDYKKAEFALDRIVKQAEKEWSKREGALSFKRE